MAERAAGAGALLAVAVCCGLPALGGAAVAGVVASAVTRSIVLGVVVLVGAVLAVIYSVRRRRDRGCTTRSRNHGDMS